MHAAACASDERVRLPDDPEPDRRTGWRYRFLVLGVLAVLGGGVATVVLTSGGSTAKERRSRHPVAAPGQLLVWDVAAQRIEVGAADGSDTRPATRRQIVAYPLVAPDGRLIVTQSGADLLAVHDSELQARTARLGPPTNGSGLLPAQPFADHDRELMAPRQLSSETPVALVDQHTGHYTRLGSGDDAVGDPVAPAVFIAVPHGRAVPFQPDDRIERRTTSGGRSTLVTAARIRRLAHLPAGRPVHLEAYPSPDGALIAVRASVSRHRGVVVLLTRTGQSQGRVPGPDPEVEGWSLDSRHLAVVAGHPRHLLVWSVDDTVRDVPLPKTPSDWFSCVWEQSATWIACAGAMPGQRVDARVLVDLEHNRAHVVPQSPLPVLWLSEPAA